ncbi:MAG: ABC transporter ATP-binding protein [Candidatus Dormibacteria bacterium]
MYQLSGVSKVYRKPRETVTALAQLDLDILPADFIAIQGPTGSGKSTLLTLLGALDRPSQGSLKFEGQDLSRLPEGKLTKVRANHLGFVFQGYNLMPTLTAQENVEAALVPLGVKTDERRERSRQALVDVGLSLRVSHLPGELSGGEQQRVAIARALVKQPDVLLADEPTGNLDETTSGEIVDLIGQLWERGKLTVVVVTHDGRVASQARRRLWMRNGTLSDRKP